TILRTTDGGANWVLQTSGTTKNLFGVSFTDSNNGTVVGDGGTILRVSGIVTGIDDNPIKQPNSFVLMQNYPNPFNPSTIIRFGLSEASFVILKIYNMLGQEVKTLINKQMNAGTFNVQWKGDNDSGNKVSSGTYIYRVIAGSHIFTKKMILLK
ncbi:MAG: T9SS type A sorting domain-containing protein, partial [Bacteroidetes bacterium]|nr:T9SS type A sorting domain-containing protein [Bacteroidota bacterium]